MMNADFFDRASAAFDQAVIDGETPRSWTMTAALYRNLYHFEGWFTAAQKVYCGSRAPDPLAGLPVDVDVGAHHSWRLYCESGVIYEAEGRSKWGA